MLLNLILMLFQVDFRNTSEERSLVLQKLNFWIVAVFSKVFPCILLTYLSIALIRLLFEAKKRKIRLKLQNETLWNHQVSSLKRKGSSLASAGSVNQQLLSTQVHFNCINNNNSNPGSRYFQILKFLNPKLLNLKVSKSQYFKISKKLSLI